MSMISCKNIKTVYRLMNSVNKILKFILEKLTLFWLGGKNALLPITFFNNKSSITSENLSF